MTIEVKQLSIEGAKLVRGLRFHDPRGYFVETYVKSAFHAAGIHYDFVQDNESFSVRKGTVRALHFQIPPAAQTKLVRVLRGRIFDAIVDLRRSSPTYRRTITVELGDAKPELLLVPPGCAHGFCTLVDNTHVAYKVDHDYSPQHERGILWSDPALGINWPIDEGPAVLSDKDKILPRLADVPAYFD
jgi:dTDP-4-dehydrorhamnose 3,5-epimerase